MISVMDTIWRRGIAVGAVVAVAVTVAACGSDDGDTAATTPAGAGTTQAATNGGGEVLSDPALPPAPENTEGADVAAAQQMVLDSTGTPKFTPPGEAFDIGEVKKPVWLVAASLKFPEIKYIADAFKAAGEAAGVPVKVVDGESDPARNAIALQQAAAAGAGSAVLMSQDPAALAGPIKKAQAAGVKVVASNTNVVGEAPPSQVDAAVAHDYVKAGQLNAAYAVAKLGADVNAVCITTKEFPVTVALCDGFNKQLAELCPECETDTQDVQVAQLATQIPALVTNAVRKNSELTFIQAPFDAAAAIVVPALRQAGEKPGDIVVGAQNGTPPALQLIKDGQFQEASAGQDIGWWGWGLFDAGARAQVDALDTTAELVPQKLFTHETLKDYAGKLDWAQSNEIYGLGDGAVYKDGYSSLWKQG